MEKYDLGWGFDEVEIRPAVEIPQWEMSLIDILIQIRVAGKDSPWGAKKGGTVGSKPIVHNGVVYFGANDHNFYAVDTETGKEVWRFGAEGVVSAWSRAAAGKDSVFFTCYDGNLYCLSLDGKLQWKFSTQDKLACTPLVVRGRVIFGSRDKNLYAVDSETGREIWRVHIGNEIASHPMFHEGNIYVGSSRGVHKISLDGKTIWSISVQGEVNSRIGAVRDSIFFGSFDGNVYCYSTRGVRKWMFSTDGPIVSDAVVLEERIFIGSHDHNYYCLNTDGKLLWKFPVENIGYTCYAADSRVFLPSFRNRLYCLSLDGKLVWKRNVKEIHHIFADENMVFAGTWDCKVHALTTEGRKLWEFHTSMSQPSEVEFDPMEDLSLEVIHSDFPAARESKQTKAKERMEDYTGFGEGEYIQDGMRKGYMETPARGAVPGVAYKDARKVYKK